MTTIDGKVLDNTIIDVNTTKRYESNLLQPNQTQPKSEHWKKQIKKIKQRYCIPKSLHLREQFILGKWTQSHHKLNHNYKWLFSPRLLEVYHNHKAYPCNEIDHLKISIFNERTNQKYQPPSASYPLHVQQNKFTININTQLKTSSESNPISFTYYCNHLQLWKSYY